METPRTELKSPSKAPWIVLAVVVVVAAAALLWLRQRGAEPAPPPPAPQSALDAGVPEPADGGVPSMDPAQARSLLESVSPSPLFRNALEQGDLVRRWAVVTDNLAEGVSPRKQLEFLGPSRPFTVSTRGGRTFIAPESYHRYDAFADAVASIDAQVVARVYRGMHAALESAYRALGYPNASLDRTSERALRRIAAAPVHDGDLAVENKGGLYVLVDPKLEELGAVEKHLLRMGPRNERLIQAKAREILQQLGGS